MLQGSHLFMIFCLGQPRQMPFHLQINAHGNGNEVGQNNNGWDNWQQNAQQENAAFDLYQDPVDMIMEDNPIAQ
jgi:hypothetical protein